MTTPSPAKKRTLRRLVMPSLALFFLVVLPLGCFGYIRWLYPYLTERAFNSNRAYYESLVHQIERDCGPSDRYLIYELRGDRLAGTLRRLNAEQIPGESYDLI